MRKRWRNVRGFPGYRVSDSGEIRSNINNRHGIGTESRILKPVVNRNGYETVSFGRGNRKLVHRVVAEAFIPNPNNYPFVRHLDDDPGNNSVENLAWGTQAHNMQDCVRHGRLVGDTSAAIEAKRQPVIAISLEDGSKTNYISINDAARKLHLWPQHISSVLKGRIRQTGGYYFEYTDKEVNYG